MTPPLPLALNRAKYRPEFFAWLDQNEHIWNAFCYQANRIWSSGRRHYSARTLIEVIRHESMLVEVGGNFKVDNANAPDLARYYMEVYPERSGFFELRLMPNSARAA